MKQAVAANVEPKPGRYATGMNWNRLMALIIPGGESTTIGKLMKATRLDEKIIAQMYQQGMPIWGTCAGMILLAKEIVDMQQPGSGVNGYNRQTQCFWTPGGQL